MFNPLTIEYPYSVNQFTQIVNPYDANLGVDTLLDQVREIQDSGNYYWQGLVIPESSNLVLNGSETRNGTIQVVPGTFVTAINYYASGNAGVKVKIYDKGTKASIFYGDYQIDRTVMSNMGIHYGQGASTLPTDAGSNLDNPYGPGYLTSPFIITSPGVLGWEIVNLDSAVQTVQIMLCTAVPVNNTSIGNKIIKQG